MFAGLFECLYFLLCAFLRLYDFLVFGPAVLTDHSLQFVIKDQFWGCHIWGFGKIYVSEAHLFICIQILFIVLHRTLDLLNGDSEWHQENE